MQLPHFIFSLALERNAFLYKRLSEDLANKLYDAQKEIVRTSANQISEKLQHQQLVIDMINNHREKMDLTEFEYNEKTIELQEHVDDTIQWCYKSVEKERREKQQLALDLLQRHCENSSLKEFEYSEKLFQIEDKSLQLVKQKENIESELVTANAMMVVEQVKVQSLEKDVESEKNKNHMLQQVINTLKNDVKNLKRMLPNNCDTDLKTASIESRKNDFEQKELSTSKIKEECYSAEYFIDERYLRKTMIHEVIDGVGRLD